jgi:hypothetical protein
MPIVEFIANIAFALVLAFWIRREVRLFVERLMAAFQAARDEHVVELVEHKVEGVEGARGVDLCDRGRTFGGCHGAVS